MPVKVSFECHKTVSLPPSKCTLHLVTRDYEISLVTLCHTPGLVGATKSEKAGRGGAGGLLSELSAMIPLGFTKVLLSVLREQICSCASIDAFLDSRHGRKIKINIPCSIGFFA